MSYKFRNHSGKGKRWSVYVQRFITDIGIMPGIIEWFDSYEDAELAAEEMKRDGRFYGIHIYNRSQETADAEFRRK
jgi:6-phosphogluconate dehydrogenase